MLTCAIRKPLLAFEYLTLAFGCVGPFCLKDSPPPPALYLPDSHALLSFRKLLTWGPIFLYVADLPACK